MGEPNKNLAKEDAARRWQNGDQYALLNAGVLSEAAYDNLHPNQKNRPKKSIETVTLRIDDSSSTSGAVETIEAGLTGALIVTPLDKTQPIIFAFPGTNQLGDWFANLDQRMVEDAHGVKVPAGFNDTLDSKVVASKNPAEHNRTLREALLARVAQIDPAREIIVTGHSQGGALAELMAASIKSKYPMTHPLKLMTYSTPPLGIEEIKHLEKVVGAENIIGMQHENDMVPNVGSCLHPGLVIVLTKLGEFVPIYNNNPDTASKNFFGSMLYNALHLRDALPAHSIGNLVEHHSNVVDPKEGPLQSPAPYVEKPLRLAGMVAQMQSHFSSHEKEGNSELGELASQKFPPAAVPSSPPMAGPFSPRAPQGNGVLR